MWYFVAAVAGLVVGCYVTVKVMRVILKTEGKQLVIAVRALKRIANWDKQPNYDRYLSTPEMITDHAVEALREIHNVDVPPVKQKQEGEA